MTELTRVDYDETGETYYKRDDLAYGGVGAKGRQFAAMTAAQPGGLPFVVGCAATSAMQLYLAAMHKQTGRPAVAFVPARAKLSAESMWAAAHGVTIEQVRPGYMTVIRARARAYAQSIGGAVRWQPDVALLDTVAQVENIAYDANRIVVAVGSGACITGILVGQSRFGHNIPVVGVCVSGMADPDCIAHNVAAACKQYGYTQTTAPVEYIQHPAKYDKPAPPTYIPVDDSPLDPYYAAKAAQYLQPGDLLWVTGCRPHSIFK